MISLFNALTGFDEMPSTVNVEGIDYTITTDFREWCRFDSWLFDRNYTDELRLKLALNFFAPAVFYEEIDLTSGRYPFDVGNAFVSLVDFWMAGRSATGGKGGSAATERAYDFLHDAPMIYAAFRQAYGIDLTVPDQDAPNAPPPMHWWTFYALFSNLPDGSVFASAKSARVSNPKDYPEKMRAKQRELKEAWALPENIRYYTATGGGKAMTEAEYMAHIRKRRDEAQRAIQIQK